MGIVIEELNLSIARIASEMKNQVAPPASIILNVIDRPEYPTAKYVIRHIKHRTMT